MLIYGCKLLNRCIFHKEKNRLLNLHSNQYLIPESILLTPQRSFSLRVQIHLPAVRKKLTKF
jgi:hypothetical protein